MANNLPTGISDPTLTAAQTSAPKKTSVLSESSGGDVYHRGNAQTAAQTAGQQRGNAVSNWTPQMWSQSSADLDRFYKSIGVTKDQFGQYLSSLPPDQQQQMRTQMLLAQSDYFNPETSFEKTMGVVAPLVSMLALGAAGGAVLGGAGTAAGGTADAVDAGSQLSYANAALGNVGGVYDTSGLLASNAAGGGITDVGYVGGASTPSGLGVDLSTLNAAPSVAPVTVAPTSYLPSAQISAALQNAGAPGWLANAGGGAVQGSAISAATGGDPLKGALGGGLGAGISTGIASTGLGSTISNDLGGGTLGNLAGSAATGAISSGLTTGLMGGDIGTGALTGAAGGAGGSLGASAAGALGLNSGIGSAVGSTLAKGAITPSGSNMATSPVGTNLPSSIVGQPLTAGTGLGAATSPTLPGTAGLGTLPAVDAVSGATDPSASGSSGTNWGDVVSNTLFGTPGTGALAGIGPYAAAGAIGMKQASDVNAANQKLVAPLQQAGTTMTNAGNTLLSQAMNGQTNAATNKVVNTSNAYGQSLIDASSPLNTIAQQAFANYQTGQLPAADQLALDNQVKAQKQQVAAQMASQGITDSSMIQAQMQQIDNQAAITKQQLLDARFQTGSNAFSQYLTGTQAGQNLVLSGQQYAVTQLNTMMQQAFGAGALGGSELAQSIDMAIQSNTALGKQVGELMQNLMMSYAIASAQGAKSGASGGGGTAGGAIGKAVSGGVNGLLSGASKLFGGSSSAGAGINGFGTVDPFGASSGYVAPDYSSSMPTNSSITVDPIQFDTTPVTVDSTGG